MHLKSTAECQILTLIFEKKNDKLSKKRRNGHRSKRFRRPRLYCKFHGVARHESGTRKTICKDIGSAVFMVWVLVQSGLLSCDSTVNTD
jgi:hypothetical protein